MATEIEQKTAHWAWESAPGWYDGYHYWVEIESADGTAKHMVTDHAGIDIPWYITPGTEYTVRVQPWNSDYSYHGTWSIPSDPVVNTYTQPVPEPGGASLLAGILLLSLFYRKWRH